MDNEQEVRHRCIEMASPLMHMGRDVKEVIEAAQAMATYILGKPEGGEQ